MKRLVLLSAAALSMTLLTRPEATPHHRGGGGAPAGGVAFGGASVSIQSARGAAAQPTFQGARSTVTRAPSVPHPRPHPNGAHPNGASPNAAHANGGQP